LDLCAERRNPQQTDGQAALDFAIGIIDYLFSYRGQFAKFQARRADRGNEAPP
jgi:hypothetical protein